MTTAAGSSAEIEAYLAAVRASLSDLAEDERADLLAEVEASLVEAAGAGDRPIASLGPPEEFAAELRASAGLGEATLPVVGSPRALDTLRVFADEITRRPAVVAARRVARELAPAWWLVRGYLVVAAIAIATGATWSLTRPWLPRFATWRVGALVIVIGVVASLALGLLTRRRASGLMFLVLAVDIVALLAIVPAERHVTRASASTIVGAPLAASAVQGGLGLLYDGSPVLNVYPYSRDGRLLHDVRLYDNMGRAITLPLGPDAFRRIPRTVSGALALNAYPIRYYSPGTHPRRVAHPDAGPSISAPRLATPPLTR
jgi:hypothetical protein